MFRRRLSQLSKSSLQVAFDCLQGEKHVPTVFASRHGEMHQLVKLLTSIITGEEVSPAAFSMSVHNTASGLLSIADENRTPTTSTSAGQFTFEHAFIEAVGILNHGPSEKVLLVVADECIDKSYRGILQKADPPLAIALLLANTGTQGLRLSLDHNANTEFTASHGHHAATFLKWFLSDSKTDLLLPGNRFSTVWEKYAE